MSGRKYGKRSGGEEEGESAIVMRTNEIYEKVTMRLIRVNRKRLRERDNSEQEDF